MIEVQCSPRLDIEAMDLPTALHIIYYMVSVQQVNLSECKGRKNFCINTKMLNLPMVAHHHTI